MSILSAAPENVAQIWADDWTVRAPTPRSMTNGGNATAVALSVVVVVLAAAVVLFAPKPNEGFADGAAVLAVVSIAALGIERIIEGFWSIMASRLSGWWPLNTFKDAVDQQVDSVNFERRSPCSIRHSRP